MPQNMPKAPFPPVFTMLSPIIWNLTRPGLFDVYAAGIIFLQLAIPEMRSTSFFRNFQNEIDRYDYDLRAWRRSESSLASSCDFSILDRSLGAGWFLACDMVALKKKRCSAAAALRHPYFLIG